MKPFQGRFPNANYNTNNFQPRAPFNNNNTAPFKTGPAELAPSNDNKLEMMIQDRANENRKANKAMETRIENKYGELNGKFESLTTHMKKLETQIVQNSESVKRQPDTLPGRTEENPKGYCNIVAGKAESLVTPTDPHKNVVCDPKNVVKGKPECYPLRKLPKGEDPGQVW